MGQSARNVVVLLSGGQDSTTVFYDVLAKRALGRFGQVAAVSFDYGQRHKVELSLAAETAGKNGVPHTVLPVEALKVLGGASLTDIGIENTPGGAPAEGGWHHRRGLPPSFVPGRNLLFFTLAAAYGVPRGFQEIATGVCETDSAGYPDCRARFVDVMASAIREGIDPEFFIYAPLLEKSKADTWRLAESLGVLDEIVRNTATCYEGDRRLLHPWGYGCGRCGACVEREKGYGEFRTGSLAQV